jgi:hypothetical protein
MTNTYQLNSIIYDIMSEFYADYDNVDEKLYMNIFEQYIHDYCIDKITEEESLDIITETWNNYEQKIIEYKQKYNNDLTYNQILQIILMERLIENININIII